MKKNNVTFAIVAVVLVIVGLAIFNFSNDQNKTKSESIQKPLLTVQLLKIQRREKQ